MYNSAYHKNCIAEVRQSVYGRDNRKPIADAINALNDAAGFDQHFYYEYDPILDACQEEIEEVQAKEDTRVVSVTPVAQPGVTDYYTLVITRANGH